MDIANSVLTGTFGGLAAILLFFAILILLRSLIRVCPSNHILVVTGGTETEVDGRKYGFRVQKGGWTFVIPFLQTAQAIDLTILPINVRIEGVNSANGISVGADATACVCIDDMNETLLYSAVQQLLGKSRVQIREQIQQTMIGNFRAALNKTTPLQAIGMVESAEGVNDSGVTNGSIDALVEVEAVSDSTGFRGVTVDDCPRVLKGMLEKRFAWQELIADAAVAGDRRYALQAMLLDEMSLSPSQNAAMLEELLEASRERLPQFFS